MVVVVASLTGEAVVAFLEAEVEEVAETSAVDGEEDKQFIRTVDCT